MGDKLKRVTAKLEALQCENKALKWRNVMSTEDVLPSQVDRVEAESQSKDKALNNENEKKKMHYDLWSLTDKYKELPWKIGAYSSVNQLLTNTNLPCNMEIMVVPLLPKFKVPLVEMYDGSKDSVEHLETFITHTTLHGFLGKITCLAFPLTLKGATHGWFGSL